MLDMSDEVYRRILAGCMIAGTAAAIAFLGYSTYQVHVTTQLQRKTWEFMKEKAEEESLRARIEGD